MIDTPATFKTTEEHFRLFKGTVLYWMQRFGLGRWRVTFDHLPRQDARAGYAFNIKDRDAVFTLSSEWERPATPYWIKRTALHEVTHMLTAKLATFAHQRNGFSEEITEEEEAICRAMETAMYGLDPDNPGHEHYMVPIVQTKKEKS